MIPLAWLDAGIETCSDVEYIVYVMADTDVYLEIGAKSVFAVSLQWPGWCRRAKTETLALEELEKYRHRYAKIFPSRKTLGTLRVIGTVKGNSTTDFGAPALSGPWDTKVPGIPIASQIATLRLCWSYFDQMFEHAPEALEKGPRGGGRDSSPMKKHVIEAERAYARKLGAVVAPRTQWSLQRDLITQALLEPPTSAQWPASYGARRIGWHVLDHAWEMEDRSAT